DTRRGMDDRHTSGTARAPCRSSRAGSGAARSSRNRSRRTSGLVVIGTSVAWLGAGRRAEQGIVDPVATVVHLTVRHPGADVAAAAVLHHGESSSLAAIGA